ncbi:MAG: methyltransferase domain-containing protein [Candidatus Rokubacteria bacterium]|nr:methyltransferase domain-containing protein [Candidatus Rokubacteria bacterium]MBI3109026.1 methyltransferase domain-containing protein [Candidatus Rokubacteria bacterium]
MGRMNREIAAWAIDLLGVHPSDRVLEVGFGPGVGIELPAKLASSERVVGVDYSKEMVEQAVVRNAKGVEAGRVDLREGSVERLPFEDEAFDSALAVNSMQVWPDALAGLREIRRVMKPGGRIALAFTRHSGQPKNEVVGALTAASFSEVQVADTDDGFCVLATKP